MTNQASDNSRANSEFERDPRRRMEMQTRRLLDDLYRQRWGEYEIVRDSMTAERLGIDAVVYADDGAHSIQEKVLSNEFARYRTLTVERYQDPQKGERGDWWHIVPQLYLVAYLNLRGDGFAHYMCVNWHALRHYPRTLPWRHQVNKNGRARASFSYIRYESIPNSCVVFSKH